MKRKGFNVVKIVKGNEEVLGFDELETPQTKAKLNRSRKSTEKQEEKAPKRARYPSLECSVMQSILSTQKLSIAKLVEDIFTNEADGLKLYFKSLSMHHDRKLEILDTLTEVLRSTTDAIEDACPDDASFVPEIQSFNNANNISSLQSDLNQLTDKIDLLTKFESDLDVLLNAAKFEPNEFTHSHNNIIDEQTSNYLSVLKGMDESCGDIVNLLSSVDDHVIKTVTTRSQLYNIYQMAHSENNSSSTKEIVKALQKT